MEMNEKVFRGSVPPYERPEASWKWFRMQRMLNLSEGLPSFDEEDDEEDW